MNTDLTTILLVDDTPDTLLMLSDMFADAGYQVLVAESGEVAIDCAQLGKPDLVMIDIRMLGMDGFETCRRLKLLMEKDVPVLLISAYVTTEIWRKALASGASDVLSKPFTNLEVLTRVALHRELQQLKRTMASVPTT